MCTRVTGVPIVWMNRLTAMGSPGEDSCGYDGRLQLQYATS